MIVTEFRVQALQDEDGAIELGHRSDGIRSLVYEHEGMDPELVGKLGPLSGRRATNPVVKGQLPGIRAFQREVE